MTKSFLSISFLLVVLNNQLKSQYDKEQPSQTESEILETIAESGENEADISIITEELQYYLKNPLNLNLASSKDLEKLGLLTPFQINSIIDYRQKRGNFLSVYELNGVPGFSETLIKTLFPFVAVNSGDTENIALHKAGFKQLFMVNTGRVLELQDGYKNATDSIKQINTNKYYQGNPCRIKLKYRVGYGNNYQCGFLMEKDPGETWFSGSNKTFDFSSAYLQVKDLGHIKNFVFGDFSACFGQGLVTWNGFAHGKTANTISITKTTEGINYYSSFNENQYLRGIASTIELGNIDFSAFYSSKYIDANVSSYDSLGNIAEVSSFQNSGIHALPSEISDEDALGEKIYGGNISFDKGNLRIGATIVNIHYNAVFRKSNEIYNYCLFSGNRLTTGGINYLLRFRKAEFLGEAATNSIHGKAFLNGFSFALVPELSIAMIYRYFDPDYYSPYANVFAQNGNPQNEKGLYTGIEFIPFAKIKINAYTDFFKYPFPKYKISSPSNGSNYLITTFYEPHEKTSISARYSYLKKEEDTKTGTPDPLFLSKVSWQKFRIQASFEVSSSVEFRNRIEFVHYSKQDSSGQNGLLLYQDIILKPNTIPFLFIARYAIFQTDDWESRIYSYENDMLYSYSVPPYYGKGTRAYLLFRYSPLKYYSLWFRYGITIFSNKETVGEGPMKINKNRRSEAGIQAIVRF